MIKGELRQVIAFKFKPLRVSCIVLSSVDSTTWIYRLFPFFQCYPVESFYYQNFAIILWIFLIFMNLHTYSGVALTQETKN